MLSLYLAVLKKLVYNLLLHAITCEIAFHDKRIDHTLGDLSATATFPKAFQKQVDGFLPLVILY